jgi:hypothetical protein
MPTQMQNAYHTYMICTYILLCTRPVNRTSDRYALIAGHGEQTWKRMYYVKTPPLPPFFRPPNPWFESFQASLTASQQIVWGLVST